MSTETATDPAKVILEYFLPNPTKHGQVLSVETNPDGTIKKEVITNEGVPVTPELMARHLQGAIKGLGQLPGDATGTTTGMIDQDTKDYTEPGSLDDARLRLADLAEQAGIKLYFEQSTRGGSHAHLFIDKRVPHRVMSRALKAFSQRAGLPTKTEVFPKGDDHTGPWYIMPGAGAANDPTRRGRTFLCTVDGEAIPYDEYDEWIERTPAEVVLALAESYVEPKSETSSATEPVDLAPEAIGQLKEVASSPPQKPFERHGSLIAFINLGRRCGHESAMVDHLKSEAVRTAWVKDGTRDAKAWGSEVDRWVKATGGERQRGIGYLIGQGFNVPTLPKAETEQSTVDLLEFFRTDYGNAERLHALFGHKFRYCAALGFLVWDGTRWRVDDGETMMRRFALDTARELFAQAGSVKDSDQRTAWVKHSLSCERNAAIRNAVDLATTIPGVTISVEELDADPMAFNVNNGTIDLKTGKLKDHDPRDLITKLAPVTFDPAAECPLWDEFQRTICDGDLELVTYKQRAYGYTATGKTSEDALFIPWGSGANGKSTEQNIILKMLGAYANTAQFETFAVKKNEGVRNDIADLMGARFVSASEGESRQRLAEGLVKQMTGGDVLKARFLNKEFFRFKPTFKLWLATNHKPVIRGTDGGIWRRIRLIPYAVTIAPEKRDKRLREKLEGELSGILNWVLKGCADWLEYGLGDAKAVNKATDTYRQESDVLGVFLKEKCIADELHRVLAKDLYQAYKRFCEGNGDDSFNSTMFGRLLNERGFTAEKTGGRVYRLGISLQKETGDQDS